MAEETSLAVLDGPKGKAEIVERYETGKPPVYEVRLNNQKPGQEYKSLGEAYIEAGEKAGVKT